MTGPFKAATRILECSLSYKLKVSSCFWGRATGRTALEVSKWVETTLEANTDRTVASVGVFESMLLAFTSVPAQNHLPVAVRKGSKRNSGRKGITFTLPNGGDYGWILVDAP
jgi:hypothetical protein